MRKQKKKLRFSSEIESARKVLKAVERKLSDKLLDLVSVRFGDRGYIFNFNFDEKDLYKSIEVYFAYSRHEGYARFDERVYIRKDFLKQDHLCKSIYKKFEMPHVAITKYTEKAEKVVFNDLVNHIVSSINNYFATNAEQFINDI